MIGRSPCLTACVATVACLTATAPCPLPAQQFDLTVENIMRGSELVGVSPSNVRFTADGRHVLFRWQRPGVDTTTYDYRVAAEGGEPERLPEGAVDTIATAGEWSPDLRRLAVTLEGDLYVVEPSGRKLRLTETRERESSPHWSADGRTIYFVRDNNAFALELATGRLTQVTDIRRGPAPEEDPEAEGQRKFLEEQQLELFEYLRKRKAEEEARADTAKTDPEPYYHGERESVFGLRVSPDGRWAAFTVSERPRDVKRVAMPLWITESGYTETRQVRPKVGDAQNRQRAGLIDVATGEVTWVTAELNADSLDFQVVGFSPSGGFLLVRGGALDYKRRVLLTVDLSSGEQRIVDDLTDDAWISGFLSLSLSAGWLDDQRVWFTSERTGYAHLYTVPATGGEPTAWTRGEWEVHDVALSPDRRSIYLRTNEGDPHQQHAWMIDVARGPGSRRQLTAAEGQQIVEVSSDGRRLAVLHSEANRPAELYVQANRPGAAWRQVTQSTTDDFRSYEWIKPEIVRFTARDGVEVPARLYQPEGESNGAAVIFVHGAGYLQNVHKWWSNYYREFMFHHLLRSRGYTVLDIDYRGSRGYGRDWRSAIYRHMGSKDLTDQVDGARWLVQTLGIDSTRIGIYGGSYGGFITLMAMFTTPGIFKAGAALRPVTDWAHYNHPYTAQILNEPQDDPEAYRRSSPIYHAEGLQGHLLICHGMLDDNVHFSDVVRLAQRLIELRKENWELAAYPVEPHGFREPTSWMDEYKRILALFERTLGDGGMAAGR